MVQKRTKVVLFGHDVVFRSCAIFLLDRTDRMGGGAHQFGFMLAAALFYFTWMTITLSLAGRHGALLIGIILAGGLSFGLMVFFDHTIPILQQYVDILIISWLS